MGAATDSGETVSDDQETRAADRARAAHIAYHAACAADACLSCDPAFFLSEFRAMESRLPERRARRRATDWISKYLERKPPTAANEKDTV